MIIGVTGGVGTGKSTVLKLLEEKYKAYIIEADKVAHDLMMPGKGCYEKIIKEFGTSILNDNKTINRKKLGDLTFMNPEKLKTLSGIVHPEVRDSINEIIKQVVIDDPDRLVVIEAALLIEAGYESACDEMWCIFADYEIRKNRLMESRGYPPEKIDGIIANQLKDEEFKKHCDYVIDNSGELSETYAQIQKILEF